MYPHLMAEPSNLPDLTKVQLQQSVETYRVQLSLLVQICTVFVVADATVVGYAIQQRLAGFMWAGLVFPYGILSMMHIIARLTLPILATAVHIEAKYRDPEASGLMSTYLASAVSPMFVEKMRAAMMHPTESERASALAALPSPHLSALTSRMVVIGVLLAQTIVPFVLWKFAGWPLLRK